MVGTIAGIIGTIFCRYNILLVQYYVGTIFTIVCRYNSTYILYLLIGT